MLWSRFLEVVTALNDNKVDYIVVGAVALGLHGHPRGTRDLDLFIRPEAENVSRLRDALEAVWNDPSIEEITAEDLCGDYPAIAYGPPDDSLPIDILTRLGDAIAFEDIDSEEKIVEGHHVRVATAAALHRMKRDTIRPQDRADAAWLKATFGLGEDS